MKILITKDTMSDIYLDALRIRNSVFIEEQQVPLNIEIDKNEAYSIHFVLYLNDHQPAATVRLLPLNDQEMKLQRMAVLSPFRGKHLGEAIIKEAEWFAKQQNFKRIKLGAQLTARGFYEKLGYEPFGEVYQEAGIEHIEMKKEL
ncbi:GNAT family acetyltransferase [Enterococcus florum]|uniref:GNAT family acetyltransferase n=1 Tax=Enterococcus florum TaxID=2480627 RepID=A0A4P5PFT8_9ENTE|nr:GNAT family N-acetyltransferase [Enterococcus florum]GCF92353.1 GNAT family acetyltransferase [Enterococcus florum]